MLKLNDQHKDRLFKFIFGNPDHKEWTLSLYNALNDSNYDDPDEIELNTIDDALYMGMRNDVSFIIAFELNLWEHQSSFSPNLPIRMLIYAVKIYEKYIASGKFNRFSRKLQNLPKPKLICFYNGTGKQPEERILRLSEAFDGGDGDIEVRVRMLNINYGQNQKLMEACLMLEEYSSFIDTVRRNQKIMATLEQAVSKAIDDMPDDSQLKKFLIGHRAEVIGMFLQEENIERELDMWREEIREDAREEVRAEVRDEERAEGREEERERTASEMLRNGEPLAKIKMYSRLAEDAIIRLAKNLGLAIVQG